jgi:internalin A
MTPQEAFQEAARRIREAQENGTFVLDLADLMLNQFPRELECLTALQRLSLSGCRQISDLAPLAKLTSLQQLSLSGCEEISDLAPLANLTLLEQLDLSWCRQISDLAPLTNLTRSSSWTSPSTQKLAT